MIRIAIPSDAPFLLRTAQECYSRIGRTFDAESARAWLSSVMNDPQTMVLRGERGGAVASIVHPFWREKPMALLVFCYAHPSKGIIGEGVRLLRRLDEWRRAAGASDFYFGDDTGIDFAPIARRLGARINRPTFVLSGGESERKTDARDGASPQATLLDRMLKSGPMDQRQFLKVIGQ